MKTRQVMIYEFMVAFASNSECYQGMHNFDGCADYVYQQAVELTNKFLENSQ